MIWYHGTSAEAAENILHNGFKHPHNWFADTAETARTFGPVVLAVDLEPTGNASERESDRWQTCVHVFIPPSQIRIVGVEVTP